MTEGSRKSARARQGPRRNEAGILIDARFLFGLLRTNVARVFFTFQHSAAHPTDELPLAS